MKHQINLKFTICLVYVIVYIVLKITFKPNFDFFTTHDALPPSMMGAIEKKRKEMNDQMQDQYSQDQEIAKIKRKIDTLRNDLKIIKSKEQDELTSIYQKINGDDSFAEAMGTDGGSEMRRMIKSGSMKRGGGKNYNLNFNLDEE